MDRWELLERLACSGAGWPPPEDLGTWGSGPDDLAGEDNDLISVLAKVPTGRLVILGEPGSGKSMLMVRLVLDLLTNRVSGGPVPVLVSLASWNPMDQGLHKWLAAQLVIDHPALTASAPGGTEEGTVADALLARRRILPLLDGLDEIPGAVRGRAISQINDALRPGEHVVVTCRSEQYRDAVRPLKGPEVTLRAAAAVLLHSLDATTVASYLRTDAGGPTAEARWDPVLADLGTQTPVGQALTTPLMVGLARTIYNPRPGESAQELADPAELVRSGFADRAAVERYLFDAFIPASYRPSRTNRWTVQQAEKWLVFLACHLERTIDSPDLAWWQLQQAMRRSVAGVVAGVMIGVLAGLMTGALAGVVTGVDTGVAAGAISGLLVWLMFGVNLKPSRKLRLSARFVMAFTMAGLAIGVLVRALAEANVLTVILITGFGLVTGLNAAFTGVPDDLVSAANPEAVLMRDRRAALIQGLTPLIGFLILGGLLSFAWGVAAVILGAVTGFVIGFGFSFNEAAWPSFVLTKGWLALHQRLPWSLMNFLADAHSRGILRQAGAVFQFRHIELQHRLATRHADASADMLSGTPSSALRGRHFEPKCPCHTTLIHLGWP